MPTEHDVLEFIIVPPYARRATTVASKERMEAYLGNRFRAYTFRVAAFAPVDGEDSFSVLPVMNFIDDEGRMLMCAEPRTWVMREIAAACDDFDTSPALSFAA